MGRAPRVFIVAGEASGDALGAGLMAALTARYPNARFEGVTGPRMRAAGCDSLADIEALSLFGIGEVIGQIPRLMRLRRRLSQRVIDTRPDVFVGIDAPAFNTGLEIRLRRAGIKTVHYVCPTAWAWRQNRVHAIRRAVDRMLAIFPFEEAFFARFDIPVTFVGHPLANEQPLHVDAADARTALSLPADGPLLGLLPGSRLSEVERLADLCLDTAAWLHRRLPGLRFAAPMASDRVHERFAARLAAREDAPPVTLVDGRARELMRAADALLLASGTATLEALLAKTPMVVVYRLSGFNHALARGLDLIKTEHVSMPNLLAGREIVPELLQADARADLIGPWLYQLLTARAARERQITAFEAIHRQLARDADARAADVVADLIESGP